MALQVWLPLNGNLNNQGLADDLILTSGTAMYKVGKIGQGLDLNSRISFNCQTLSGLTKFSVAFWAKVEDNTSLTTNWQDIIGFTDQKADNSATGQIRAETCYNYSPGTGIHWHDNATYAIESSDFSNHYSSDRGIWHHCVLTVDSNVGCSVYTDGNLIKTTNNPQGGHITGVFWLGETNNIAGCINDVRIYDHVLSPREVAEIAKGLVLHYPLNDSYIEPTTNLCTTQAGGWNNSGTCVRNTDDTSILNKPIPGPVYSLTATSDGSMAISLGNTSANLPSKTLVASVYCWLDGTQDSQVVYLRSQSTDGSVGNLMYNGGSNPLTWPKKRWIRLVSSPITTASNATTFYICTYVNKNTEVRAFNGWQIEENTHVTDWVAPGTTRAASTIVYDTSGFGYNGTANGTFSWSSDTPKYGGSTKFDTNSTKIKLPVMSFSGMANSYTFAGWQYNV